MTDKPSNVINLWKMESDYDGYGLPCPVANLRQDPPLTNAWRTGWPDLDEYWRLYPGQFTVVTGLTSSGKSLFLFNVLLQMSVEFGFHCTLWVPENENHLQQIVRRLYRWGLPENADAAAQRVCEMQWFCQSSRPDYYEREPQDIITLLNRIGARIEQDQVSIVVLDPWNEVERAKPKDQLLTDYIGDCLMYMKRWARQYQVALIMVAHPTKAGVEGGNSSLYDIEGSANWANKCDNGLVIERNYETNVATIKSRKVREIGAGKIGQCQFKVDPETGIYTPLGAGIDGYPETKKRNHRNS